jgi:probable rRNA maturation factor
MAARTPRSASGAREVGDETPNPGLGGQAPVVVLNRQRRRRVDLGRLREVVRGAAAELGAPCEEVVIVLSRDGAIRALNRAYRHKDAATDVLSFRGAGGEGSLGDVVISVETAERNAARLGCRLQDELETLVLHGYVHLLGYDHETDDGRMARLERRLRARLLRASGRPARSGRMRG